MKTLKQLLTKESGKKQPLPLFSKLKELKLKEPQVEKIYGVPMVSSDCSDEEEEGEPVFIQQIRQKLERFKHEKALEIVSRHQRTRESIDEIAEIFKDQYQYEALCLIDEKYRRSAERCQKSPQEGGSTLPSSSERRVEIETPGFDLPSSLLKPAQRSADLRQFTLGQRGKESSNQSTREYQQDDSFVSEFRIHNRQTASRKIKNKIMNPQRV